MSKSMDLVRSLQSRGVSLWLENGVIRLRAPKGALLPEEIDHLRVAKAEISKNLQEMQSEEMRYFDEVCPLTATQRMPWFCIDVPGPQVRTIASKFRILGSLDVESLQRSISSMRRRHDVLRARIRKLGDTYSMHIARSDDFRMEITDLTEAKGNSADKLADEVARSFINKTIDRAVAPLFDAKLIKLSDREHLLVTSTDHVISDGLSNEIITRELWEGYRVQEERVSSLCLERPAQFTDYAVWLENSYPSWERAHGSYWREHLAHAPPLLWPTTQEPGGAAWNLAACKVNFNVSQFRKLDEFSRTHRVPLPLLVLSAYIAAVSLWLGQQDLTVTFVDSGRHDVKLISMVGCLACHLHLRIRDVGSQTFSELPASVAREFISASEHRGFDWVPQLVPGLNTDLCFNWTPPETSVHSEQVEELTVGATRVPVDTQLVRLAAERLPHKLILIGSKTESGMTASFTYKTQSLKTNAVELFAREFQRLLEMLIESPLTRVGLVKSLHRR